MAPLMVSDLSIDEHVRYAGPSLACTSYSRTRLEARWSLTKTGPDLESGIYGGAILQCDGTRLKLSVGWTAHSVIRTYKTEGPA